MALVAAGVVVGFQSRDWTMGDKSGRSHRLSVSTGDTVEEIAIGEDDFLALSPEDVDRMRVIGQPVVARVTAGAFGGEGRAASLRLRLLDLEWVSSNELKPFGFQGAFYVGE